jgi:UDP-N-acetylmuramoyl-L-alanyl-D-glutamate--2,6-diaminopimelate ligase
MQLRLLIQDIKIKQSVGQLDSEINSLSFDSRNSSRGTLFIALKGSESDGHDYIAQAISAGATAVVCEKIPEKNFPGVTLIETPDSHQALGIIASRFRGNPSEQLKVIGITGTNGKTTTVTLLYNLFTQLGYSCGLISTIENKIAGKSLQATHTTPDPLQLNSLMQKMVDAGCEFCFMEVSSHALHQKRTAGIKFYGAIFSNITHDHLDYHKTFMEYIKAKKRLFDNLDSTSFALVNIDDKNGNTMLQNCKASKHTYSCRADADFTCKVLESTVEGMLMRVAGQDVWTRFIGLHNAYNLLAVYAASVLSGASREEVLVALSSLGSVPGRLEYVKGPKDITAVIDYAHTPDALENVLRTLSEVAGDRDIVTVFGCGGDRDKSKRPEMAAISEEYSSRIIVTTDNPRFEEPADIIEDIKRGFSGKGNLDKLYITDRREAIKLAIATSSPGSIVLIAGKGHETYQEVKGVREHFDDKEEVINFFKMM